jgi:hypothetical protein
VQTPTKYERGAPEWLDLTIPPTLPVFAHEVIEQVYYCTLALLPRLTEV